MEKYCGGKMMTNSPLFKNFINYNKTQKKQLQWNYFIVTVDTESDDAWATPKIIKLDNLKAIPRFQELCENYHVIPTYLITYECANREEAIKILKPLSDSGRCEIGHHLHVWTTPPFSKDNGSDVDLDWIHAYQSELPDTLFYKKAETLRLEIENNYGVSPSSHRAGRWGIDKRTIKWLMDNNFLVDTSVLPLTDYSKLIGKSKTGPNFFYESFDAKKLSDGDKELWEIPVTVNSSPIVIIEILKFAVRSKLISEHNAYKIFRKFGGGTKLTPSLDFKLEKYLKTIRKESNKAGRIINFSLHSTEISLGHSPITRTLEGYKYFWSVLENSFKLINELNIKPLSLSNAVKSF
jgi:hypothetical protein